MPRIMILKSSVSSWRWKLLDFSNRAEKLFLNGTIEIRRKVVKTLFDEIKMYEGEIVVSLKIQPFAAEVLGSVESGIQIV